MTLADPSRTRSVCALPRLSSPDVDAIEIALRRAGCVIVENAVSACDLAYIYDGLDHWFDHARTGEGPFFGCGTKRFSALFAKAAQTSALAIHPIILPAVEHLLLGSAHAPHGDCIQLSQTQAIEIAPGEGAQLLHRDDGVFPFAKSFELLVNVMYPLDDFTAENGATRLIPGSHLWPREDIEQYDEDAVDAIAPAGSAIIWTGALIHGGGANRSLRGRRGIVMSYSLGWLAQAEKLMLSIPPSLARTLPARLQALIGYQIHHPNLGWVEGRCPSAWLRGETGPLAAVQDNLTPAQTALMNAYLATANR